MDYAHSRALERVLRLQTRTHRPYFNTFSQGTRAVYLYYLHCILEAPLQSNVGVRGH